MNCKNFFAACVALALLLSAGGCKKPRTLEQIEAEQRALPALYLTEKTLKEVRAPADKGAFVDEETGEICYRAYECTREDCPGRSADGKPYLFIHRDVLMSVGDDGKFVWEQIPAGKDPQQYIRSKGGQMAPTCPKCLEKRDLDNESDEQKQEYLQSVRLYELPEIAKRREELEAEYQEAFKAREALRHGE